MSKSRQTEPEHLVVGQVGRAHGIKGDLRVWPLTDRPEEIFAAGQAVLLGDRSGELPDRAKSLTITRSRPHQDVWIVKFEEVPDRTAAEMFRKRYLFVRTEALAPPEADEVYYHDLLGMEVVTLDGETVGRVHEVYELEPAHMLDVRRNGGSVLVPFSRQVIKQMDVEGRRLIIDPPPGLLEL